MTDYVAGFAFSPDGRELCLVRKLKPAWQAGRLNAVGGKIEPGETPIEAMVREFREEAGTATRAQDWQRAVVLEGSGFKVIFFRAFFDLSGCHTAEREEIVRVPSLPVPPAALPNLCWLVPLLLDGVGLPIHVADHGHLHLNRLVEGMRAA